MHVASLKISNLGPFDDVEFEFDRNVNVLVGPNNCGKSTALVAIADLSVSQVGVPDKLLRDEPSEFLAEFAPKRGGRDIIGGSFPIIAPTRSSKEQFAPWEEIRKQLGYTMFIPALRWSTDFRSEGPIRPKKEHKPVDYVSVGGTHVHTFTGQTDPLAERRRAGASVSLIRDEEIVQEIIDLDYRAYIRKTPSMREIIEQIASIASEITDGFPLKFAEIAEDRGGYYPSFDTPDGKLPLNVLSQGTQSLVQWLARLLIGYAKHYDFPDNLNEKPGVLIIDEIDAHLHPSWQRRIIPALAAHFPSLQIFCSTHSPLMLAGLKAGQIHLLERDRKGNITVSRNATDIIGWSVDEISTSFLGVEAATDLDSEQKLLRLKKLRSKKRLSTQERKEIDTLREAVHQNLLRGPAVEEVVDQLTERLNLALDKSSGRSKTEVPRRGAGGKGSRSPGGARGPKKARK